MIGFVRKNLPHVNHQLVIPTWDIVYNIKDLPYSKKKKKEQSTHLIDITISPSSLV